MSTEDHPDWWRPVGGQNSQDSTLERRSLVWNDNDVVAPAAPPTFYTNETYIGKFFTRGCRGMIEELQIYCRRTAAGVLRLRYSPHPCLGPVRTVLITPGAAWGWAASVAIQEMWDYDSLFVWVYQCDVDVSWAFDAVAPHDGHYSPDLGATWGDLAVRPFIRAVYTGETPGDVPVSGIVNTVKIPSTGTQVTLGGVVVPSGVNTLVSVFEGAGTLVQATILIQDDDLAVPTNPWGGVLYRMRIIADGALGFEVENRDLTQSSVATFGRSSCGEFLMELAPASGLKWLKMNLRVPIEFRHTLELYFFHSAGNPLGVDGLLYANVLR